MRMYPPQIKSVTPAECARYRYAITLVVTAPQYVHRGQLTHVENLMGNLEGSVGTGRFLTNSLFLLGY